MQAAVGLARQWLAVPYAVIKLVDDRSWVSGDSDDDAHSLSASAVTVLGTVSSDTTVVPDLAADERTFTADVVTGDPHLRFFAGQPLRGPQGHTVGCLAVFGQEPRTPCATELKALRDLALLVEAEFARVTLQEDNQNLRRGLDQARRLALVDGLTETWNRSGIVAILNRELSRARRFSSPVSIIFSDLDHFKRVNDTYGHLSGDEVLRGAARRFMQVVRPYDAVGRYGGEEFLIVAAGCDAEGARRVAEGMRLAVRAEPFLLPTAQPHSIRVTASIGVAVCEGERRETADVIEAADQAMYRAKNGGRDRIEFAA